MVPGDGLGEARDLVLAAEDLAEDGWRALATGAGGSSVDEGGLEAVMARLPEEAVIDVADSPLFVRPPARLAYSSAAVFRDVAAATEALAAVGSAEFARGLAGAVAADVVVAPGGAELLGSHTRPLDLPGAPPGTAVAGHRTTFGGATAEHVVPVHVDLLVLGRDRRLVLVWVADAPDPFPAEVRSRLLARLAERLAR